MTDFGFKEGGQECPFSMEVGFENGTRRITFLCTVYTVFRVKWLRCGGVNSEVGAENRCWGLSPLAHPLTTDDKQTIQYGVQCKLTII